MPRPFGRFSFVVAALVPNRPATPRPGCTRAQKTARFEHDHFVEKPLTSEKLSLAIRRTPVVFLLERAVDRDELGV